MTAQSSCTRSVSPSTGQSYQADWTTWTEDHQRRCLPAVPFDGDRDDRDAVTTVTTNPARVLGRHSLSRATELLARQLGITAEDARLRLQLVAENIGLSGTELAELILHRETVAD